MPLEVGSIVEGVVTGITHFGAFVTLPTGQTGLVHISEVADTYVRDIKEFLKENDRIRVKILSVDPKGKIGLSIRQVDPRSGPNRRTSRKSFEDKLNRFMKDSEERLTIFKRSTDAKRGGRGSRRD
jgi:S1 RNA binding domain protein